MLQAMFSGVSGLQVHQTRLNVAGNNIANVNTLGFKAGRVTFQDQLSQTLRSATSPSNTTGGQNPAQVGLGVTLGAVDTVQTQGNLQTTGKATDLAIQGNGFFLVSNGQGTVYTRDGSFDIDSSGVLVNPSSGMRLLGWVADKQGIVDISKQVATDSYIRIPIGTSQTVRATSKAEFRGNLDASAGPRQSSGIAFAGNFTGTSASTTISATAFDEGGAEHAVQLTLDTKTDAGTSWQYNVTMTGGTTTPPPSPTYTVLFDKTTGAYVSGTLPNKINVTGTNGAPNFDMNLSFQNLKNLSTGSADAASTVDGKGGNMPTWNTSVTVYDSQGTSYLVNIQYKRTLLGTVPTDAEGATRRWEWTASVDGQEIANSNSAGNSALYFDSKGLMLKGDTQGLQITETGPAEDISMTMDFGSLSQLAGASTVAPTLQNGFANGVLQSFGISPDGLVTGVYSNGQTQTLGKIAMATFSNPAGLEKMGQNLFAESSNSGQAQVGQPLTNGRGKINTGFVEMSNVDLSNEFTNLIITQRGFQANTRIITVVDDLLQDVINLKR